MNRTNDQRYRRLPLVLIGLAVFATACSGTTTSSDPAANAAVDARGYAKYVDANGNGINDFVEGAPYHDPGAGAPPHVFIDANGDGVCDYAQNGTRSWHGPGYLDANGDGVCDRWSQGNQGPQGPGGGSRPWCW